MVGGGSAPIPLVIQKPYIGINYYNKQVPISKFYIKLFYSKAHKVNDIMYSNPKTTLGTT